MSDFMQMYIYQKGALYGADCSRCGCTNFTHEWVDDDHNERRDAMEHGRLGCDQCAIGRVDRDSFMYLGRQYAGRYSADGYMDCTSWHYGKNKRELARELRDMYGDEVQS